MYITNLLKGNDMGADIINIAALFIGAAFLLHLVLLFRIIREVNNSQKYSSDKINYISVLFPFNMKKILNRHREVCPDSDLLKLFRTNNIVITVIIVAAYIYIFMK